MKTSGTTGRPKGATLTHGCLLDNAQALVQVWEYQADDILVHSLPIFHVHGLFIALHPTMLSGAQVRFLPRFETDLVINALAGATVFMGVPTYYHRLLSNHRFDPADDYAHTC
jgi:malonyl-CoA/methylmalonyl-CoA synthetase